MTQTSTAAKNRLRSLINDRRQKDGGYGREKIPVCLDPDLVAEYNQKTAEKDDLLKLIKDEEKIAKREARLSDGPNPKHDEVAEIDARLEELKDEIETNTAVLVFASMGDKSWSEFRSKHDITNEDPKIRDEALDRYFDEMLDKCFLYVEDPVTGEKTDLALVDFTGKGDEDGLLSFMQAQEVRGRVQALNLRGVSVPFSLSTSNGRRKTSSKSRRRPGSGSATAAS